MTKRLSFCPLVAFALVALVGQFNSLSQSYGVNARDVTLGSTAYASADASSQEKKGYPKYCCTEAGVLGPYDNDSVPEGGACYGTKDGKRYEGKACYGKESEGNKDSQEKKGYPKYCCTEAGVLGPYDNDSVPEGGACYGTKDGKRYEGKACYGEKKGYPKYCCTDAGKLGPYNNDSVPEGGACYGTKDGKRYEGKACY